MNNNPTESKDKAKEPPAPEVLQVQSDNKDKPKEAVNPVKTKASLRLRHGTYRPSHKATFIGLAVVVLILAANAGIVLFLINNQADTNNNINQGEVTISPAVLDTLGVSRSTVGTSGTELIVTPNSRFNGTMTVGGNVSIAGELKLNSKFTAGDANLTKLEAGDTSLEQLNVNGDATASNLNLRKDLTIAGVTRLQGTVTVSQLLTVNNSVNILGNLAVGGTLSMGAFQTNTLTIGGHITTRGSAPSLSKGGYLRSTDTVSISGNDVSGTVGVNIGAGNLGSGILAYVSFVTPYSTTPHVVISSVGGCSGVGSGVEGLYVERSASGFSIGVKSISGICGHAFDYIVMQ